jgi:hypothetical protein
MKKTWRYRLCVCFKWAAAIGYLAAILFLIRNL